MGTLILQRDLVLYRFGHSYKSETIVNACGEMESVMCDNLINI